MASLTRLLLFAATGKGMGEMAKFPYLTGRRGSKSLYYKRMVPLELRGEGRPEQIWRSLGTPDRKKAETAYAAQHAEVERLFEQWRCEESAAPPRHASTPATKVNFTPLTPGLLRRLADAHYLDVYEQDFQWRGDLWTKVHADEDAFWRGEIIELPENDWHEIGGKQYSSCAGHRSSSGVALAAQSPSAFLEDDLCRRFSLRRSKVDRKRSG